MDTAAGNIGPRVPPYPFEMKLTVGFTYDDGGLVNLLFSAVRE